MPQKFEDSMIFPLILQAVNGPYSLMRMGKSNGKTNVQHQKTCPVCDSKLVNLDRHGNEWKCRKCWEKGENHG